jgi:hypothetical protein
MFWPSPYRKFGRKPWALKLILLLIAKIEPIVQPGLGVCPKMVGASYLGFCGVTKQYALYLISLQARSPRG